VIEAVDVVVRVTDGVAGEQRSFVVKRVTLDFNDWAIETFEAIQRIHRDDVDIIFDECRKEIRRVSDDTTRDESRPADRDL
jgi:hypothetical protein